jgi:hypothetical protein
MFRFIPVMLPVRFAGVQPEDRSFAAICNAPARRASPLR